MNRAWPLAILLAAGGLLTFGLRPVAAEESAEATRQYNTAAALHNLESWDQAAPAWRAFINGFPQDPRVPRALHYLGVCLFNQKDYEGAAEAFQQSLEKRVEQKLAQLSLLYRGIALYEAARQGKGQLYGAARASLEEYLRTYPEGAERGEASFYLAELLYFQGQKEQAAAAYRRFLDSFPGHPRTPDVLLALGLCEEELGNRQAAIQDYQRFLQQYSQHGKANEVLYRLGEVYYSIGNYEQADLFFRKAGADSRFPDADLAVVRSGDALVQLKRFDQAAQQYASVEKRFPQSPRIPHANLGAGKCYYQLGQFDTALSLFQRAAQLPEIQAEAVHWMARCYLKRGQPQQVPGLISDALIAGAPPPWNATLQLDRADALYELADRREQAIAEYARAAEMAQDPEIRGEALYAAAHTALALGNSSLARQYAEQFQKQVPKHVLTPEVTHVLAECDLAEGRFEEASRRFDELATGYPKHPQLFTWRLRQLVSLQFAGKHKEVVQLGQAWGNQFSRPEDQSALLTIVGASQLEMKDVKGAQESLLLALARSPKGPQSDRTMLLLASAYSRLGQIAEARKVLEKLLGEYPQSALLDRAYYQLGEYCFSSGDYAAAEAAYREILQRFQQSPLVPGAMYQLACVLMKRNNLSEAERLCTTIVEKYVKDPVTAKARYLLALIYNQQGQPDRAMPVIEEAIQGGLSGAERAAALYVKGLIHIAKKEYDQAAGVFRSIIDENPDYADADKVIYQWAWAEKLAGREKESVTLFQRLADSYPNSSFSPEAKYHVASDYYNKGRYDWAATLYHDCYTRAQSADLKEKAIHRLGWCYFKLGQYENAAKTFTAQRSNFPQGSLLPDAIFMEAESTFRLERYSDALKLYEGLPPLDTKEYEVLRLLHAGQAAAQTGQIERSLKYFGQLQQQFPDVPEAVQASFEIGMLHYNQGDHDSAWKRFQEVLQRAESVGGETAARAQFMIGEIQMERKQYEDAVKSFFRVAYGYQSPRWQAAALYEAARCFESLQRLAQAAKLYQELIEKFPESDRIADAKAKLETLKQGSQN